MLSPTVSGVSYRRVFDVEGFRAECRVVGHRDHFAAVTLIQFHSCRIMRKPNPSRRSMDTEAIIKELEAEKARLDQAITALWWTKRGLGRPAGSTNGRKRRLSPAARNRISEAMKRRWAARKKAA
jgi:hypothetical protein